MGATQVVNLDLWVSTIVDNLEGPGLSVFLHGGVVKPPADQSPSRKWGEKLDQHQFTWGWQ